MIEPRDVVTIKIPYPDITSGLAISAHMFICNKKSASNKDLVKCQTFTNQMLIDGTVKNYIMEKKNPDRNPFKKTTLIDCDKIFRVKNVRINLSLLTDPRNICKDLHKKVNLKLKGTPSVYELNREELKILNGRIS